MRRVRPQQFRQNRDVLGPFGENQRRAAFAQAQLITSAAIREFRGSERMISAHRFWYSSRRSGSGSASDRNPVGRTIT